MNDQSDTSHEVWNAFGSGGFQSPSGSTITQSIARIQVPYIGMSTLGNGQDEPVSLVETPSDNYPQLKRQLTNGVDISNKMNSEFPKY